jgi:hypothetical protein
MAISYTIQKIENGLITIQYEDGAWAEILFVEGMNEQSLDDIAAQFATKPIATPPETIFVGQNRIAKRWEPPVVEPTSDELRRIAYESEADPLFFQAQRGELDIQVWLDKVAEIKQRYPDTSGGTA